jgi:hypothetical protein
MERDDYREASRKKLHQQLDRIVDAGEALTARVAELFRSILDELQGVKKPKAVATRRKKNPGHNPP